MRTLSRVTFLLIAVSILFAACKTSSSSDLAILPRSSYDIQGVSFSLADLPELTKVNRDSVGWAQLLPQTDENAPIVYYFLNDQRTLTAPHIRLEYIDKKLPGMGEVNEIHDWLKSVFVNETQKGELISEGRVLSTMDGQDVSLLEIVRPANTPNDSISLGLKMMAWAYIDHNDRYIACNFSATMEEDYKPGLVAFEKLVRSYKDE